MMDLSAALQLSPRARREVEKAADLRDEIELLRRELV